MSAEIQRQHRAEFRDPFGVPAFRPVAVAVLVLPSGEITSRIVLVTLPSVLFVTSMVRRSIRRNALVLSRCASPDTK